MLQKGKARLRRAALSGDRSYFVMMFRDFAFFFDDIVYIMQARTQTFKKVGVNLRVFFLQKGVRILKKI